MSKVIFILGTLFFILSLIAFALTIWLMWKDFAFWKLIANVIATFIGAFWGIVLLILAKKFGH
ncbi:MAG: hypothetical protein E3J87_06150 [Candidatus Cloacimonadota bacterium]|nr:MAG: hypothetical protein E3J87_06150 [Candidatus Cloacimonadota bacterium]